MESATLPFWQRSLITFIAMIVVGLIVGFLWRLAFGFGLPDYVSGVVGGLTAVPLWEFLKQIRPKQ